MRSDISCPEYNIWVLLFNRLNHGLEDANRNIAVVVSMWPSSLRVILGHSVVLSAALNGLASVLGSREVVEVDVQVSKLYHLDGIQILSLILPLLDASVELVHKLVIFGVLWLGREGSADKVLWVQFDIVVLVPAHVDELFTEEVRLEIQLVQLVHNDVSSGLNVPSAGSVVHEWLASEGHHIDEQVFGNDIGKGSFKGKNPSLAHITGQEVWNVNAAYFGLCQEA